MEEYVDANLRWNFQRNSWGGGWDIEVQNFGFLVCFGDGQLARVANSPVGYVNLTNVSHQRVGQPILLVKSAFLGATILITTR